MGLLSDIGYPQTGDIVEEGLYACMNCYDEENNQNETVLIKKRSELPECPNCGFTHWIRV